MIISWQGEFFINGHIIEYLDGMNYWTFLELIEGINTSRSEQQPKKPGRTKKISKAQMEMKEARIKQREKEGIKYGR